jgi:nucleoside-triphosphatase THEP1
MQVRILSASRGEGKTSFLRRYVNAAAAGGRSVGGVASLAVFEDGRRIGYDLLDLRSARCRPLARVAASPETTLTVGIYQFDNAAVEEGNAVIVSAVRDGLDIVAIDELGPLELQGGGWAPALKLALQEGRPQQELVVVVRPSLIEELPSRFPSPFWEGARRVSPPWPVV